MGGRAAVPLAVAVWAGILVGGWQGDGAFWCAVAAALPLAWLGRRAPDRLGTLILVLACFACAAARGAAGARALRVVEEAIGLDERPVWVRGVVLDHPGRESGEPVATLRVVDAEGRVPSGARIRVRLPPATEAEWGDQLELLARLETPRARRSPGGLDARAASHAQGIVAQGRALVARRRQAGRPALARVTFARWRRAIERSFERELGPATREIVTPLVIGDRSGVGAELGAQFRAAGLTHLLALSGLHVTWMAAVARGLAALAGRGVAVRAWAGALCALLYVGIAGPLPSLMRAAATELVVAWARLHDRALDPVQALAVSAIALLALAPGWACDLGFQLSCAATLGLVTLGAHWTRWLSTLRPRAAGAALRALAPTAAAQVVALPLMLDRFHALPWTALAANLVAVPVCELLLAAAWLGAAADVLVPGSGRWAFGGCEALAAVLRGVARVAAEAPLALLPTGHAPALPWIAAASTALLAWSLAGPRDLERAAWGSSKARRAALGLGALGVAVAALLAVTPRPLAPPPDRWWLVVLDVGQGDALALGFPDGWWLVDAGPRSPRFDAGASTVLPFFRWAGVRRLRALVLTHDHGDHTGGAGAVLGGLAVERLVLRSGMRGPGRGAQMTVGNANRGDTLWREPRIVVRWPPAGARSRDENAISMVLEVGAGEARALLAADVDSIVEASLPVTPALPVLKVAHHGASASSGAQALARLSPRVAVVSCGSHNPFGHPDPGALERLALAGAVLYRTDREGTIWLELGPRGVRRLDWASSSGSKGDDGNAPYGRECRVPAAPGPLARGSARW